MKTIKMKCESCGGTLDVEKEVMFCPYCGAKTMIVFNDNVQIAKIKADAKKEISKHKIDAQKEIAMENSKLTWKEVFLISMFFLFLLAMMFVISL